MRKNILLKEQFIKRAITHFSIVGIRGNAPSILVKHNSLYRKVQRTMKADAFIVDDYGVRYAIILRFGKIYLSRKGKILAIIADGYCRGRGCDITTQFDKATIYI